MNCGNSTSSGPNSYAGNSATLRLVRSWQDAGWNARSETTWDLTIEPRITGLA